MSEPELGTQDAVVDPSTDQSGFGEAKPELSDDLATGMAQLAKEQGIEFDATPDPNQPPPISETPAPEPTPEPTQPEAPQAEATPAVPEKFQTEEGQADPEKVEKAEVNVDQAMERYLKKERELKQKINEVKQLEQGSVQPQLSPPPQPGVDDLARQIEDEIKLNGTGVALTKLFNAASDMAYERARKDMGQFSERQEAVERKAELQSIAKADPSVFTDAVYDKLSQVRAENPWIEASPTPWKTAYDIAKGRGLVGKSQSGSGTPNPTPTGAPVTPPSGARTVKPHSPQVDLSSEAAINKHLDGLTPEQEKEFWKSQGFPAWRF